MAKIGSTGPKRRTVSGVLTGHAGRIDELERRTNSGGAVKRPKVQSGDAIPIADPVGVTREVVSPDPITGEGSMTVLVFPQEQAAMAIKIAGDAYPRWILSADPTDFGLMMGDGTFDPTGSHGGIIGTDSDGSIYLDPGSAGRIRLIGHSVTSRELEFNGASSHPESIKIFGTGDTISYGGFAIRIDGTIIVYELDGETPKVTLNLFTGAWTVPNLPTSDPHVTGQWWADSGVVTVSAG